MTTRIARFIGAGLSNAVSATVVILGWEWQGVLGVIAALALWWAFTEALLGPALIRLLHALNADVEAKVFEPQRERIRRWEA